MPLIQHEAITEDETLHHQQDGGFKRICLGGNAEATFRQPT